MELVSVVGGSADGVVKVVLLHHSSNSLPMESSMDLVVRKAELVDQVVVELLSTHSSLGWDFGVLLNSPV